MTITLHQTSKIVEVNGVPARVWEGKTAAGVECVPLITRIAVSHAADCEQFEKELMECQAPSVDGAAAFPTRLIL